MVLQQLTKALYENMRDQFTVYGWRSFLSMVGGICITDGKKTLKALSYLVSDSALSRLFNGEKWPTEAIREIQRELAVELIKRWYWNKRGRNPTVHLLIDGTVLAKRGKDLPKVGWHYDTRIDGMRRGQKLIIASIKVGELLLPWDFRVYVNEEKCKEADFQKSTEQAADMVHQFKSSFPFPEDSDPNVVVGVDGGLCVKRVLEASMAEGFDLVGKLRVDRKLEDGRYARDVESGTVARLKGMEENRPVQIVKTYDDEGNLDLIASTDTKVTSVQVRRRMDKRNWAEKTNEELKGLGLEDCSCLGENAVERWAGLVMFVFTLLAHIRWDEPARLGERDHWPRWNEVGKRLGQYLFGNGGLWAEKLGWLKRGLVHLREKSPLFDPLLNLWELSLRLELKNMQ